MIKGFDYAADRPPTPALVSARAGFVLRYVSTPGNPKNLSAGEAQELHAAGIPIGLVYETTADWMLGGFSAGQLASGPARAQATALGFPPSLPIYAAADFGATTDQVAAVLAALSGWETAGNLRNPVGVYGGLAVVQAACDRSIPAIQTDAWSSGQWDERARIRQSGQDVIDGVSVDVDLAPGYDLGLWMPPVPTWQGRPFTYAPDKPLITGSDVERWQQRMADRGWTIAVDGEYGEQSWTVCTGFQTEFHIDPPPGLVIDGDVGLHTWTAAWAIPISL